jgi:transposase domain protein
LKRVGNWNLSKQILIPNWRMYYTDFISFMENPQNEELIIMAEKANSPPKELDLFD